MATPVGHALIGLAVARRLGVESPAGLAAAAASACLPDADLLVSHALHGNAWKLHRKGTHSTGFALAAGMVAGAGGLLGGGRRGDDRDVAVDMLTGVLVAGSHLALDRIWLPYLGTGSREMPLLRRARREAFNAALDALFYGAIAWALWPRTHRDGSQR